MLDSAISLADHSESQKELCILEWKQISLLGLAYHLIIQLPIGPVSYNTSWKCQSPTTNMLNPKDPECLTRNRKFR